MEVIEITRNNRHLVASFINKYANENPTFRYFKNRTINALDNHLYTLVILNENDAIGYAHLDKEDSDIWLGVAIANAHQGKGLATLLIRALISRAKADGVNCIKLAVDIQNEKAIRLYEKNAFKVDSQTEKIYFYKLIFNE